MVKTLTILVVLAVVGLHFVSANQRPGIVVSESETQLVMGGTCYKVATSIYNQACYMGCSGGGCGCSKKFFRDDTTGYTKSSTAVMCETSENCTDILTVTTTGCGTS